MYIAKYLSFCGVCSRRAASLLVKDGEIEVNGKVVTDVTYMVKPTDVVKYQNKIVKSKPFVYILLNKPRNFITTLSDEKGRKVVVDLIKHKAVGRIYPVGRLDRMTTGVLLLTNDGDFAQQLSHPKYNISKVYKVVLTKNIRRSDFEKLLQGVKLEDGFVKVDKAAFMSEKKNSLIIEIHSGKNRIIRRIFERLEYEIKKLQRVSFAGLTVKGLNRGEWRFLSKDEVHALKGNK